MSNSPGPMMAMLSFRDRNLLISWQITDRIAWGMKLNGVSLKIETAVCHIDRHHPPPSFVGSV